MKYKINHKKTIFKEPFVKINEVNLEIDTYNNKKMEITRYALIRPEVVALLLYNKYHKKVIMVEQFRYSSLKTENGWVKEIVAGIVEPNEDPITSGRREAIEESGYKVVHLELVSSYYPSWGFSDQIVHLYFGEVTDQDKVAHGGGLPEEKEDIKTVEQDLSEVMEEINTGKIKDSKTIIAMQWLSLKLSKLK